MEPDTVIGIVFAVLGLVGGVGLLFVKIDQRSIESANPMARLYQYDAFRYFVILILFIFAAIGVALALGWISFD